MREFKQYLLSLLILTVLLSGFVFLRFADRYPLPVGSQFEPSVKQRYKHSINEKSPQIIVLGDSVVGTNVDAKLMSSQLGKRVMAISEPGAGSALLYLILKNNIAEATSKPDILIIIFRNTVLTSPGFRVHGAFFRMMDEYGGVSDDLALQLAIRNQMTPVEKLAEAYFPPYWARRDLRAIMVKAINYPARIALGCTRECYETAMGDVFGILNFEPDQLNEAMNSAENFLYIDENVDFDKQVDRSFLPEIVRICKENNIQLILVRTKILRFSPEHPEPPALSEYMDDLNAYAQKNGIPLIDFAHVDRLKPALFDDANHLNQGGKKVFTEMLLEALGAVPAP